MLSGDVHSEALCDVWEAAYPAGSQGTPSALAGSKITALFWDMNCGGHCECPATGGFCKSPGPSKIAHPTGRGEYPSVFIHPYILLLIVPFPSMA